MINPYNFYYSLVIFGYRGWESGVLFRNCEGAK
jgi:hypothetical protein